MTAREEIRAALQNRGTLNRTQLVAACDAQPANVDVTLNSMVARGELLKAGERGSYTYTLNAQAETRPSRAPRSAPAKRPATPPATKRVVTASPERDIIFALDADEQLLVLKPDGEHILFSAEQTLKVADLMFRNFTAD